MTARQLTCARGHWTGLTSWAKKEPASCPHCPNGIPCDLPLSPLRRTRATA